MNLSLGNTIPHGTNIMDVEIPPELDREVSTGIDFVDAIFGGEGMTPSQAILFSGEAGSGKTTLMMSIADSLTKLGHICLFNSNEEADVQLAKTRRRLGITDGFIVGNDVKVTDVIKHLKKLQKQAEGKRAKDGSPVQVVLILDSLQAHDDGRYPNGYTNSTTAVNIAVAVTKWCKTKNHGGYGIAIIIGQVSKGGEFEGKNKLKHAVDSQLHLSIDDDTASSTYGTRLLEMRKNRMGAGAKAIVLSMHRDGLREQIGGH